MGKHAKLQTQRNSRKESVDGGSEKEADRKERERGQQTITSNFQGRKHDAFVSASKTTNTLTDLCTHTANTHPHTHTHTDSRE